LNKSSDFFYQRFCANVYLLSRFQKVSGAIFGCVLAALTASAALSAVTDPKPAWETSAKQVDYNS